MTDREAIEFLLQRWLELRAWAEELIQKELGLESAVDILGPEYRGKRQLGDTEWWYRTHGVGVEVTRGGRRGGIDFDFTTDMPCCFKLREFMVMQLNGGELNKRIFRPFLHDKSALF